MDKFEKVTHVEHKHIEMWNIRHPHYEDTEFTEEDEINIEQWNGHDWKNLIAFKNIDAWYEFNYALENLAEFYNRMERSINTFKIFYKSYNIDNLTELQNDSCKFIRENYWDDVLEFANEGYFLIYFTTQRECHDRNQFLMYMLDSWMYDRTVIGHRVNEEDEIKDIEFIVLNEK